jgi:hypothetical protein
MSDKTTLDKVLALQGLTGATETTRFVGGTSDVAPTSGAFEVGDLVVSRTGKIWVCTVAGSPGTWAGIGGASSIEVWQAAKSTGAFPGTITVSDSAPVNPETNDVWIDTT